MIEFLLPLNLKFHFIFPYRDGADWFCKILKDYSVPLYIVSAGIGGLEFLLEILLQFFCSKVVAPLLIDTPCFSETLISPKRPLVNFLNTWFGRGLYGNLESLQSLFPWCYSSKHLTRMRLSTNS